MADEQELISKRNNLIAYVLNNASNKLPITLNDVAFVGKAKEAHKVIAAASKALKDNYGIILEEVPEQKTGKKYICYSENLTMSIEELDDHQKREITLLFIILSYIFLTGGTVYEESLENFLKGLDISYYEEHCYFGPNLKKLITETFVKQLYLKRKKSESEFDVEVKYTIQWDFRAHKEFPKSIVLETAATLMGKSAKFFNDQYLASEAEREDNDSDVEMV